MCLPLTFPNLTKSDDCHGLIEEKESSWTNDLALANNISFAYTVRTVRLNSAFAENISHDHTNIFNLRKRLNSEIIQLIFKKLT